MELYVLARHGESTLNLENRINGDFSVPVALTEQGRRKFLKPLYEELVKTPAGKERAVAIYKKAHGFTGSLWTLLGELRSTLFQRPSLEVERYRKRREQHQAFTQLQPALFV